GRVGKYVEDRGRDRFCNTHTCFRCYTAELVESGVHVPDVTIGTDGDAHDPCVAGGDTAEFREATGGDIVNDDLAGGVIGNEEPVADHFDPGRLDQTCVRHHFPGVAGNDRIFIVRLEHGEGVRTRTGYFTCIDVHAQHALATVIHHVEPAGVLVQHGMAHDMIVGILGDREIAVAADERIVMEVHARAMVHAEIVHGDIAVVAIHDPIAVPALVCDALAIRVGVHHIDVAAERPETGLSVHRRIGIP